MKKEQDSLYVYAIIVVISVTLSVILSWYLFSGHQNKNIVTIDLSRIHSAELMMTMKASQLSTNEQKSWIKNIEHASGDIKNAIEAIAPNSIVIVSPAVIIGAHDITNKVLHYLGLPTNAPRMRAPRSAVLGGMEMQKTAALKSKKLNQTLTFLKP